MSEKLTNFLCGKKREKIVIPHWYLPVNKEVNSVRLPRPQRVGGARKQTGGILFFFTVHILYSGF